MPRLLILGGTAWLGRETAREALARGWEVTCLARGESGDVAPGATLVRADRDAPDAYAEVAGTRWDAVVEVSWQPRHVREAAEAISAGHWTYISSVAAYAPTRVVVAEDSLLRPPVPRDAEVDGSLYDAAKVRCELDTVATHPDALLVRAGVIAGPGDPTERLAYWPRRAVQAGDHAMIEPAGPSHPLQVVDVRDLVAWLIGAIEAGVTGAVNAVGPQVPFEDLVSAARDAAVSTGARIRVEHDRLGDLDVRSWKGPRSLPLWVADHGGPARTGYHSDARFLATGARRRPLAATVADVMEEEIALGVDREVAGGLTRDEELALLEELA
ncbi:reductase [Demequina sp. SYSU T00039]|uniref:Reductase n=1 Tax=Demequina lignilytica TaxID=3051663 RepID=A0AAW7M0R1_9MICO|nr:MULTISPECIES: NAD-dependent epimerase/dehydratase family protein [unclassified Demequina]MDN4477940.1 reductase [Demequina sp. SYSU T00039-1]MDN4487849.1 reductase [Demequina sp. SYSU T00039]MDN4490768.1 reductase [Demequina sp. SYSU T00068]